MTYIVEGETPIVAFYRQFDGYIEGHGQELAAFLAGRSMVNGISLGDSGRTPFNGIGDLAYRTLVAIKNGSGPAYGTLPDGRYGELPEQPAPQEVAGSYYITNPADKDYQEYNYFVSIRGGGDFSEGGQIWIQVYSGTWSKDDGTGLGEKLFEGTPEELLAFKEVEVDA